jgi:uncharacterized protein
VDSLKKIIVGLISDTHGLVRPDLVKAFAGVELILHAGDVGGTKVLEALTKIAPTLAVYGNVDDPHDPALARERVLTLGGITIHVSHGHEVGRPNPELMLARYRQDIVVFGHTHRAEIYEARPRLCVNPGAAGPRRFDLRPSVARLTMADGRAQVDIVSLDAP